MNVYKKSAFAAAAVIASGWMNISAGNIEVNGLDKASGWLAFPNNPALVTSEDSGAVKAQGRVILFSKKFVTIDPAAKYQLSGMFRAAPGTKSNRFYFGFQPFDANRKQIQTAMVGMVSGTETELAGACKPGDKKIRVVDASMWLTGKKYCVAFNIKPDGADLPNRTLSSFGIKALKAAGSVYEAELEKPCGISAAAGTKIRLHQTGSTFICPAAEYKQTPSEWQEISGVINPEAQAGTPQNAWWKGTKMCRIIILANYGKKDDTAALEFKDIKLEKKEDEATSKKN